MAKETTDDPVELRRLFEEAKSFFEEGWRTESIRLGGHNWEFFIPESRKTCLFFFVARYVRKRYKIRFRPKLLAVKCAADVEGFLKELSLAAEEFKQEASAELPPEFERNHLSGFMEEAEYEAKRWSYRARHPEKRHWQDEPESKVAASPQAPLPGTPPIDREGLFQAWLARQYPKHGAIKRLCEKLHLDESDLRKWRHFQKFTDDSDLSTRIVNALAEDLRP
jgi:hypothetical protein